MYTPGRGSSRRPSKVHDETRGAAGPPAVERVLFGVKGWRRTSVEEGSSTLVTEFTEKEGTNGTLV